MPAYDYKCETCGTVKEIYHGIKEDALKEFDCPKCGSKQPCKRLISRNYCPPVFKGNDWTVKSSGFGAKTAGRPG